MLRFQASLYISLFVPGSNLESKKRTTSEESSVCSRRGLQRNCSLSFRWIFVGMVGILVFRPYVFVESRNALGDHRSQQTRKADDDNHRRQGHVGLQPVVDDRNRKSRGFRANESTRTARRFKRAHRKHSAERERAVESSVERDGFDTEPAEAARCSPAIRRALAQRGDNAGQSEWREMAKCVVARNRRLRAHFVLHISKSGGSSLCAMYKANNCSVNPRRPNCWEPYELAYAPAWVRNSRRKRKNLAWLSSWQMVFKPGTPRTSCRDMRSFRNRTGQQLQMDEGWLPHGAPCHDFLNAVSIREPVRRLLSHWAELHQNCLRSRPHRRLCRDFFTQAARGEEATGASSPLQKQYNVPFLLDAFDVVSDNYVTRTLNGVPTYSAQGLMAERKDADGILQQAIRALERFDWVLLLDSPGPDLEANNAAIIRHGLGLPVGMGHRRARGGNLSQTDTITAAELQLLRDINRLDYAVWERAQELHALDLASLRQMAASAAEHAPSAAGPECCGHVC